MKAQNFIKAFTIVTLIFIPATYLVIALTEGSTYWLAGIMFIAVLFAYAINFSTLKKL